MPILLPSDTGREQRILPALPNARKKPAFVEEEEMPLDERVTLERLNAIEHRLAEIEERLSWANEQIENVRRRLP